MGLPVSPQVAPNVSWPLHCPPAPDPPASSTRALHCGGSRRRGGLRPAHPPATTHPPHCGGSRPLRSASRPMGEGGWGPMGG